jgi:hypothetical protein
MVDLLLVQGNARNVSEEVEGNLIGGMNPARLKVTSSAG